MVLNSNPVRGEMYSIQHYVIKIISDLRQIGGFSPGAPVSCTNKTKIQLPYDHDHDGLIEIRRFKSIIFFNCWQMFMNIPFIDLFQKLLKGLVVNW
jgi:hypothetical protein